MHSRVPILVCSVTLIVSVAASPIPDLSTDAVIEEDVPEIGFEGSTPVECPALISIGPIVVESDGQEIKNKDIIAGDSTFDPNSQALNKWTAVPAIKCSGKKNVKIKNVRVTHYPQGKDAIPGTAAPRYWAEVLATHPGEDKTVSATASASVGSHAEEYEDLLETTSRVGGASIPAGAREAPYSQGIVFDGCDDIEIENVRVQFVGAPTLPGGAHTGALASFRNFNIMGERSKGVKIKNIIVSGGSSGVWLGQCEAPKLTNWASYNVHGPFPRGQCFQFSYSHNGHVSDFICKNQWQYSYPEDAISFWRSANSTIKDGVILGNSASTGVGLMFEQSDILNNVAETGGVQTSWGLAENIQGAGIGGACYSAYGGTNIVFKNCGCRDNHCAGRANRAPGSAIMWYAGWENPSNIENCCFSSNCTVEGGKYYNTCRKPYIWQGSENPNAWVKQEIAKVDFVLNEHPVQIDLCFKINGEEYKASTAAGTSEEHIKNIGLYGSGFIDDSSSYNKNQVNNWRAGKPCKEASCEGGWRDNEPWSTKCDWGNCQGCDQCADDYVAPPPPTNTNPTSPLKWNAGQPCVDAKCRGAWRDLESWTTKCYNWGKCRGCSECDALPPP